MQAARKQPVRLTRLPSTATRADRDRPGLLARFPSHTVNAAYRRAHWLNVWRTRCDRRGDGDTELSLAADVVAECKRIEGGDFRITARTLQRWHREYTAIRGDGRITGVEGLIDKRSTPSVSGGGGDDPPAARDPAAVEWFYSLYRTESQLSARMCHDATLRKARKERWAWPTSYAATTAWLREHDDRSTTFLLRHGKDKWARRYLSHIEVDYGAIGPGDLFVCDHHEADYWCTYKGKQIRPWITAIQDCSSRCIVGWHVGPAPHQDAVLASMRRAFREWAIPVKMRIDNGRDYTSKLITGVTKEQRNRLKRELGPDWQRVLQRSKAQDSPIDARWLGICGELSIELIYAIPYAPWSKGTLERLFGRLEAQHGKTYVTYCGNSAVNKPECLEEIRRGYSPEQRRRLQKLHGDDWRKAAMLKFIDQGDLPTLEECRERLGAWIDTYHLSGHRGLNGATPLAVWQTAGSLQRAVDDDLLCLMDIRGIYRVGGNGVRVNVGGGAIGYGQRCAALKPHVGRDVLVALNPDDISHVWAYTPDRGKRKPIGRLDANQRIAPNTRADDAREAIAETMRERKTMHAARRSSARRTRTQAERINEHSRAVLAELRQTGTDGADNTPTIVPIQTGFEGGLKADRTGFDPASYCPEDSGEIEDLFDDDCDRRLAEPEDDQGMEDLFDDSPSSSEGSEDDGLESML